MASTYTTRNRLNKQGTSDNVGTWGAVWNASGGSDLLDYALDGVTTVALSASDVTLTAANGSADQSRARVLKLSGVLSNNVNVIIPNVEKNYIVANLTTGSFTVGIKTASGSAVTVTQSSSTPVWCDGANAVYLVGAFGSAAAQAQIDASILVHNNSLTAHYYASDTQRGFIELATSAEAAAGSNALLAITPSTLKSAVLSIFFPVGSIYTTTDDSFDPNITFGGTWTTHAAGRMLVGKGSGSFATVGGTGGAETKTLATAELPSHTHFTASPTQADNVSLTASNSISFKDDAGGDLDYQLSGAADPSLGLTSATGSGTAFSLMNPYIVVKFWRRTA